MKKLISVVSIALLCVFNLSCAQRWTEDSARQEAFRDVKYNIDLSQYPALDPDFQENQRILQAGEQRIEDRFITKNDEPPIGYIVSKMNGEGYPTITMFYGNEGHLISVRLFSRPEYPRVSYIYCVDEKDCKDGNKEYKTGELMSVSLRVSANEEFYFLPDGKCTGRVKF